MSYFGYVAAACEAGKDWVRERAEAAEASP